jgi:ribonuclease HII
VAAAVVLPRNCRLPGVNDSKQLPARVREELSVQVKARALTWSIGVVNHRRIDAVNIRRASFEAMLKALAGLALIPDYTIVDGFPIPGCELAHAGIVGGDRRSLTIAAASILAKVFRDRIMDRLHVRYPGYGFDRNRGYATPEHLAALVRLGPSPIHRRSFAPVRDAAGLFPEVVLARSARGPAS